VLTYYLKDAIEGKKKTRQTREKKIDKDGGVVSYPSPQELRDEADEEAPAIVLTVTDADGHVVRRLTGPTTAGFHRVAWDLRLPPADPTSLEKPQEENPFDEPPSGPMLVPGSYTISFAKRVGGALTALEGTQTLTAKAVGAGVPTAADRAALVAFLRKTARLQRAVLGASAATKEALGRLDHIRQALDDTPGAAPELALEARALGARLKAIKRALEGDDVLKARSEPTPPAIQDRVQSIVASHWSSTAAPTQTNRDGYAIAGKEFAAELEKLRAAIESLRSLEGRMESAGAPWTPGRLPTWSPE
jgi:hypothetical protein